MIELNRDLSCMPMEYARNSWGNLKWWSSEMAVHTLQAVGELAFESGKLPVIRAPLVALFGSASTSAPPPVRTNPSGTPHETWLCCAGGKVASQILMLMVM